MGKLISYKLKIFFTHYYRSVLFLLVIFMFFLSADLFSQNIQNQNTEMKVLTLTEINSSQKSYYFLSQNNETDIPHRNPSKKESQVIFVTKGTLISGLNDRYKLVTIIRPASKSKKEDKVVVQAAAKESNEVLVKQISELPEKPIKASKNLHSLPSKKSINIGHSPTDLSILSTTVKTSKTLAFVQKAENFILVKNDKPIIYLVILISINDIHLKTSYLRGPPFIG